MQLIKRTRSSPFGPADITKLEDLFIFDRGHAVKLGPEAHQAYEMWRLVKKGFLKPYEYQMTYDKVGNPIVYKDDVDVLLLLDSLNDQGIAHEKKKQDQMAAMKATK